MQRKNLRTTKTSEKLVLFPQQERNIIQISPKIDDSSRVTGYSLAERFVFERIIKFLREYHILVPRTFDECLYFLYDSNTKERVFNSSTESEEELILIEKLKQFSLPLDTMDSESLFFLYDESGTQPRIFNDLITLKNANPMVKLSISHAIGQSVKLSLFENVMDETIANASPLPKMMAKYGKVKMPRNSVLKIIGELYKLKMNVNLVSNVLDSPDIFWSYPELEGVYKAIRGYLEISQRAELLNSRADVLEDLLTMLTDHLNSNEMTYITWIIIILITVAAAVAAVEVGVKFLKLNAGLDD